MTRVLIADDSPTAREFLSGILQSDPDIEVVGAVENGLEAVNMVEQLRPKVVIMDVNMPVMNGFEATKEIMIRAPTATLLFTGEYDVTEGVFSGNCFRSGALCALPKLPAADNPDFDIAVGELLRTVKQLATAKVYRHWRYAPQLLARQGDSDVVQAIGVTLSHRGAPGFGRLLAQLPDDFGAPVLVVPHLGHGFNEGFVAWLQRACRLTVKMAEHGEEIAPGTVYVARENVHLTVSATATRAAVNLSTDPPSRGFRPSSSRLFGSLADVYGDGALALFLRGLAEDAMLGLCAIRLAGGRVLAQKDERPPRLKSLAEDMCSGLADAVLSMEHLASQLCEVTRPARTGTEATRATTRKDESSSGLRLSAD